MANFSAFVFKTTMEKRRIDIDGLRAIAVISVIVFHYNENYLKGGFIGVDVFFVISGYLMTKIILSSLENGSFNYFKFTFSRAKRIFPALLAVVFLLLIFGFLFIEPLTLKELGKHSAGTLLFISNYIYFLESGYFDKSSLEKFLLHSWSLSVEWQFYLIYPFVFYISKKILKDIKLIYVVLFLFLLSLSLSIYYSKANPNYGYYMLHTRAWEMLAGAIVFLLPPPKHSEANSKRIEIASIFIILASIALIDESNGWPTYLTIVPVLFTSIIIWNHGKSSILKNRLLQHIGRISYSAYLVHWPIIVICRKTYIEINLFIYLVITILLAQLLYATIEQRKKFGFHFILLSIFTLFLSLYTIKNGLSFRLSENQELNVTKQQYRNKNEGHDGIADSNEVIFLNSNEKSFEYILIGSSHAKHYLSYINKNKLPVASLAVDGCNSTRNYHSTYKQNICIEKYRQAVNFINLHKGKAIIWSTPWGESIGKAREATSPDETKNQSWEKELSYFIEDIKESDSKIFLIGNTQGTKKIMHECLAKANLPLPRLLGLRCDENQKKIEFNNLNHIIETFAKNNKNTYFINASDALCDDVSCKVVSEGIPIYTDYGHLSKHGAEIVGKHIFSKIDKIYNK